MERHVGDGRQFGRGDHSSRNCRRSGGGLRGPGGGKRHRAEPQESGWPEPHDCLPGSTDNRRTIGFPCASWNGRRWLSARAAIEPVQLFSGARIKFYSIGTSGLPAHAVSINRVGPLRNQESWVEPIPCVLFLHSRKLEQNRRSRVVHSVGGNGDASPCWIVLSR